MFLALRMFLCLNFVRFGGAVCWFGLAKIRGRDILGWDEAPEFQVMEWHVQRVLGALDHLQQSEIISKFLRNDSNWPNKGEKNVTRCPRSWLAPRTITASPGLSSTSAPLPSSRNNFFLPLLLINLASKCHPIVKYTSPFVKCNFFVLNLIQISRWRNKH